MRSAICPGVWQLQRPALWRMMHWSDTMSGMRPYMISSVSSGFIMSLICDRRSSNDAVAEMKPA